MTICRIMRRYGTLPCQQNPSRFGCLLASSITVACGAVSAACEAAAAPHPDAELLRLGREFDRLHTLVPPLTAERKRIEETCKNKPFQKWATDLETWESMRIWRIETGLEAAIEAEDTATQLVDGVTKRIREIPAKTPPDLA